MEAPIPQPLVARSQGLKNFEKTKKYLESLTHLMNRLKTCKEQRSKETPSTYNELRSVQHFEIIQRQQETEMDQTLKAIESLESLLEKRMAELKRSHQIQVDQYMAKKNNLEKKRAYVDEKLLKARERLDSVKDHKTKEELNLEKQIVSLIEKWDLIAPNCYPTAWGSEEFSEARKLLNLSPNPTPPTPSPPPPPVAPPEEPPNPKVKRGVKKTDDQTKSDPVPLPPPVSEAVPEETPVEEEPEVKEEVKEEPKEEKKFPPTLARSVPRPQTPLDVHPAARLSVQQVNSMSQAELFAYMNPGKRNPLAQPKILTSTKRPTH